MKLGHLYTSLEGEWTEYLLHRHTRYPLLTEAVFQEARIVVPEFGRAYRTGRYLMNGRVVSYDEIRARPGFVGTYAEEEIWMVEVWEDHGDDGHIRQTQIGWRFVPSKCLQLRSRTWHGELRAPEPMLSQIWDWDIR